LTSAAISFGHLRRVTLAGLLSCIILSLASTAARAAELVMFARPGCPYCLAFDREVGTIYGSTDEGRRFPLRRVDIAAALPADLDFVRVERFAPVFVLVDNGREIGRIRGYASEEQFWGSFAVLLDRLRERGPPPKP